MRRVGFGDRTSDLQNRLAVAGERNQHDDARSLRAQQTKFSSPAIDTRLRTHSSEDGVHLRRGAFGPSERLGREIERVDRDRTLDLDVERRALLDEGAVQRRGAAVGRRDHGDASPAKVLDQPRQRRRLDRVRRHDAPERRIQQLATRAYHIECKQEAKQTLLESASELAQSEITGTWKLRSIIAIAPAAVSSRMPKTARAAGFGAVRIGSAAKRACSTVIEPCQAYQ